MMRKTLNNYCSSRSKICLPATFSTISTQPGRSPLARRRSPTAHDRKATTFDGMYGNGRDALKPGIEEPGTIAALMVSAAGAAIRASRVRRGSISACCSINWRFRRLRLPCRRCPKGRPYIGNRWFRESTMAIAFAVQTDTRIWIVPEQGQPITLSVPNPDHGTLLWIYAVLGGRPLGETYSQNVQ